MLGTTHQIRMLLSQLENNIRILLKEREQYAPLVEKLKARIIELENEQLKLNTKSEDTISN